MTMTKLMEFRTVFLRSIAEAWFDDGFRTALLRDAERALRDRFGFHWPWGDVCKLVIMSSHGQFEWLSNEWVYASTLYESLILRVPLDASSIDPPLRASALGDYYRQHASLFDDDWGHAPTPRIGAPVPVPAARPNADPVIGPGSAAPVGGFMPTDDAFSSFKVALLVAMAKAWDDASFKKMLTIDAAAALHTIRDYKLPWIMTVRIEANDRLRWSPDTGWGDGAPTEPVAEEAPRSDGRHELRLYLPDTPRDNVQPLALATYNATGAEYPFTCTC